MIHWLTLSIGSNICSTNVKGQSSHVEIMQWEEGLVRVVCDWALQVMYTQPHWTLVLDWSVVSHVTEWASRLVCVPLFPLMHNNWSFITTIACLTWNNTLSSYCIRKRLYTVYECRSLKYSMPSCCLILYFLRWLPTKWFYPLTSHSHDIIIWY